MKDQETKAEFILMRAQGLNYEEIGQRLNVSKPTLIKWNKEFAENIYDTKKEIMEEFVARIYQKNSDIILNQFGILDRTIEPKPGLKTAAKKAKRKSLKRLNDLFGIRIKAIELFFDPKNYELAEVKIECEDKKS